MPAAHLRKRICLANSLHWLSCLALWTLFCPLQQTVTWAQSSISYPMATVEVEELEQREVAGARTFVGDVVPLRRAVIGSAVAGRVERLLVDDGDLVGMPGNQAGCRANLSR
jgi:multidrug efflux pump subunit AcrA (membrane-fusion protein)